MPVKLNQINGMPQMKLAFSGWQSDITLMKITQTNNLGEITNTETAFTFKGTVQPLSAEQIQLKPEGQRSFKWLQIHCLSGSLNLVTDDRIVYNGEEFKIMATKDYSLNGYIEYHLIQGYTS